MVMTKKGRQFFPGKIGSAAPDEGKGPTFFSEQGSAESKSGPGNVTLTKGNVSMNFDDHSFGGWLIGNVDL